LIRACKKEGEISGGSAGNERPQSGDIGEEEQAEESTYAFRSSCRSPLSSLEQISGM